MMSGIGCSHLRVGFRGCINDYWAIMDALGHKPPRYMDFMCYDWSRYDL